MLKQFNKRLRYSAVVTTAIMAVVGCDVYAHEMDNQKTQSPIKHVIVILGENRTFDHLFATYEQGRGEHVDNLLSKGIINKDGTPWPELRQGHAVLRPRHHHLPDQPWWENGLQHHHEQVAGAGHVLRPPNLLHECL